MYFALFVTPNYVLETVSNFFVVRLVLKYVFIFCPLKEKGHKKEKRHKTRTTVIPK